MEEMNSSTVIRDLSAENRTRKILEILEKSSDLEEAIEKVRALLN
ncbi:MAG: protein phosphatase [Clostridia bacterium]|nr:protein phosphatase [Clostridia bacterium]